MSAVESYSANPFATRPPGHFADLDCTNDEYHTKADGVSNSMLGVFLDDPALFHGRYIEKRYPAPAPSGEMEFGTLVHSVLLEDGLSKILEIPPHVLAKNGARLGSAWHAFELEHADKVLLKPEEIGPLREIRRNAEDHPQAAELLFESDGWNETTIEWTDRRTGLLLKSRRDRVAVYRGRRVLVDVKTTASVDPREFAATCYRYGYHRQQAFYTEGTHAQFGEFAPMIFVAIRNKPPYSVRCYDLSDSFFGLGISEVEKGLAALAIARGTNVWSALTASLILTLDAPRYAFANEWEI
jgi:hypothetical protein